MASVIAEPPRDVPQSRKSRSRSPEVKAFTALLCGAAACLAAGALFPMTPEAPVRLASVFIVVALAMAAGTWFLIDRAPRRILLAEACVACVLNSVLVSQSATPGGAIADAFAYVWLTVYVAAFFPRAWWPYGLLVAAAFGGGLIGAGLDANLFSAWMVLSVSVLMAGFVVAMISRAMLGRMSTDALTGTLNRSGLHDAARRLRLRRRRDTPIVTVAALDLDGFKAVNDTNGHATGDRLLAEATAAWRSALRADDVLARTGGDEFIVLMPNTGPSEATAVLDRLRSAHPVAWSAGIAPWEADEPLAACIERADAALYEDKHASRAA
ncbi:diguanylate cyclase [Conexibacter woesei]|uniref:diguanylate cyclase n=1 Tax=Conexibacter woesei TaxID=191495 RepID=UPI0009DBF1DE|nr:diguanylate cyclase [Conexibacter woesei]